MAWSCESRDEVPDASCATCISSKKTLAGPDGSRFYRTLATSSSLASIWASDIYTRRLTLVLPVHEETSASTSCAPLTARYEASRSLAHYRSRTCSAAADADFESGAAMDLHDDLTVFGLSVALLAVAYAIGRVVGPKVTKCEKLNDEKRPKVSRVARGRVPTLGSPK